MSTLQNAKDRWAAIQAAHDNGREYPDRYHYYTDRGEILGPFESMFHAWDHGNFRYRNSDIRFFLAKLQARSTFPTNLASAFPDAGVAYIQGLNVGFVKLEEYRYEILVSKYPICPSSTQPHRLGVMGWQHTWVCESYEEDWSTDIRWLRVNDPVPQFGDAGNLIMPADWVRVVAGMVMRYRFTNNIPAEKPALFTYLDKL